MPNRKTSARAQSGEAQIAQEMESDVSLLEEYIQDLWKFLPLPICYVNPIYKMLDVNTALLEMTGYENTEVIGQSVSLLLPQKGELAKIQKELGKHDSLEREVTLETKGKEHVPVRVYLQRRKDEEGETAGYFLALIDITKEKEFREELEAEVKERTKELEETRAALMNILEDTEEARRRAEEDRSRTQAVIENFPDGLMVFSAANQLEVINRQAERIFDVKSRDILAKTLEELKLFPTVQPLAEMLEARGEDVSREELEVSQRRMIEVTTIPLEHEGELQGTIVALHDITREKEVERLKTEFVSLAAHQLRTPLSAIKWTLRMLLDEEAGTLTEEQRGFLQKTYRSNERMISLINDLLDVTRIEEGRYLYKPEFHQIGDIVRTVVDSHKEAAERKDITLSLSMPDKEVPRVMVDPEKLQLAVQNLVENAINYTEKGGTVKAGVRFREKKREVEVFVQDTGMGIPGEQQDRVFEKFFRAQNAKRVDTEGSGLGLYLVKNIMEAHEGRVWFESAEGKGSTFHLALPVKKEIEEFLKKF